MALLLQVPGVQGEQPSGPIKLTWRQGQPAPEGMASLVGAAVVHGSTAYFSSDRNMYSYTVPENKWTKLPQCKYSGFAMAVINNVLTTIGGWDRQYADTNNTLLSLSGRSWEEVLPPMPTKRMYPAAANTPTHLVVAGGRRSFYGGHMATVEVLNTKTLQWSTASSLPQELPFSLMTTCGGCIYLANSDNKVFSCSVEDLKSTNSSDGGSVWTRLANIPAPKWSTLATLSGRVLAIGGEDGGNPTGAIHCYDAATNSWCVMGEMPTPRSHVLTAVLPSNELVVVGGYGSHTMHTTTEIASCQ